jgi:hypothetical protein
MKPSMITFVEKLAKLIDREVVVEGTFPIPIGQNEQGYPITVYSPIKGKLVDVYADGFSVVLDGYKEPREFLLANVRSVMPVPSVNTIVLPPPLRSA